MIAIFILIIIAILLNSEALWKGIGFVFILLLALAVLSELPGLFIEFATPVLLVGMILLGVATFIASIYQTYQWLINKDKRGRLLSPILIFIPLSVIFICLAFALFTADGFTTTKQVLTPKTLFYLFEYNSVSTIEVPSIWKRILMATLMVSPVFILGAITEWMLRARKEKSLRTADTTGA